jgi:hypothetical protein
VFLREQAITPAAARWPCALAICISIRSIRMRKGWRRLSFSIPTTIIRRITTTGTPM